MRRAYRWLRSHPVAADRLLAVVASVPGALFCYGYLLRGYGALSALALLCCLPLWYRTRHPTLSMGATVVVGLACLLLPFPPLSAVFTTMVMAYTAAAYAPRRQAHHALVLAVAGGAVAGVRWVGKAHWVLGVSEYMILTVDGRIALTAASMAVCVSPLLVCWLWGGLVNARHAHQQTIIDHRAESHRLEQETLIRMAVVEERTRIAREMHDVVAHSLSVIVLQSDGARDVLDTDTERARQALDTIGRTSRQALTEMRALLGVLRPQPGADAPDGRAPQPGIEGIGVLADRLRSTGLPVRLDITGDLGAVPAGVGLSAHRIVQEALTNTLKHAGPGAAATVTVACRGDRLTIEVADDGRGAAADPPPAGHTGHGLLGMRERAAAVRGQVHAGPRSGGGFLVSASLPLDPQSPRDTQDAQDAPPGMRDEPRGAAPQQVAARAERAR